jgi:hypothetical protein
MVGPVLFFWIIISATFVAAYIICSEDHALAKKPVRAILYYDERKRYKKQEQLKLAMQEYADALTKEREAHRKGMQLAAARQTIEWEKKFHGEDNLPDEIKKLEAAVRSVFLEDKVLVQPKMKPIAPAIDPELVSNYGFYDANYYREQLGLSPQPQHYGKSVADLTADFYNGNLSEEAYRAVTTNVFGQSELADKVIEHRATLMKPKASTAPQDRYDPERTVGSYTHLSLSRRLDEERLAQQHEANERFMSMYREETERVAKRMYNRA